MGKHWCYFLFMLWFTYLIISSILLFAKGFLLSKDAQEQNSTCLSLSEIPCLTKVGRNDYETECSDIHKMSYILQDIKSASSICLPQKSRIIFIIIDALRYDFVLFDENQENPLPHQNKLPIIKKLLTEQPENTRLYKFVADPPTTTMQRLKALTTGSLPTFIDAGSNFATNEITEDNIIDQLIKHNLSTVLIGDDTWDGLYPKRFLRKYPYPSFDVWDLDTVDDGVTEHLYPEVLQQDWSLLIAHYLGVDHCGHRYGPNHSEMIRKLTEMNDVIQNVVQRLDSDTMLYVIGDHGMTDTGNHGGDSEDEVTSAFFIYSKKSLSDINHIEVVRQISIVPTMAAVFGVPIPFSNLGTVILDALPKMNISYIQEWQWSLFYLWGNVQQMMTYIDAYSKSSPRTFNDAAIKQLQEKFSVLKNKLYTVTNEAIFENFTTECGEFLTKLRQTCESVWIQFDSLSMTRGLLFLFLSMVFVYLIVDGIPRHHLAEIFQSSFLVYSYIIVFSGALIAGVLYYFQCVENLLLAVFFWTGLVSQFMLVVIVIQNWELISLNWYDRSKKERISNLVCRLVLIFHLCGLFSNSFVIEESSVLLFFITTVILMATLTLTSKETKSNKSKYRLLMMSFAILIIMRISVCFWRCRDRLEQPWCYEFYDAFLVKTESTKLQWLITTISLALFVTLTKTWLRSCGNLNGYNCTVMLLKYGPTVLVVCTSGFWILNRLLLDSKNKLYFWQTNALAWIIYALSLLGIITIIVKPLCVYILPRDEGFVIKSENNIIHHVFQHVKNRINRAREENVPILYGLGTTYSAVYVGVGIYLTHLFALLHGDAMASSTVIMFVASMFVLIITSIIRLEKAASVEELFNIPNMSLLIWMYLAQYFFYGTGHQPSFPNINWNAAFIGTSGIFSHNLIRGTLIIINTFCSQILLGFLVPLLVIMPFTVSVILPSFISKNVMTNENSRGEILLYERSDAVTMVFTTTCKYIVCHSIRIFATMLSATIHCRHMMIWKIFAPKFIFESVGMFVTLIVVNLGYLLLIRVNFEVNKLMLVLNKQS